MVLKKSLMNIPVIGLPNYQMPLFFFVYKKERNAIGLLIHNRGMNKCIPYTRNKFPYPKEPLTSNWIMWHRDTVLP